MPEAEGQPQCLACGRSDLQTPLVPLRHMGGQTWICPQDLPVLIHDPARLGTRLPGAETLRPADPHD